MNQPLINTNGCLARLTNVNFFFNYHGVTFNAETVLQLTIYRIKSILS